MNNIKLSDFVKTSITEIVKGIEDAQDELKNKDVLINPITNSKGVFDTSHKGSERRIQDLEFDLSVTASSESSKGASFIAVVSLFAGKGDVSSSIENASTSRLKFSIPVSFPTNTKGVTRKEREDNIRNIANSLR